MVFNFFVEVLLFVLLNIIRFQVLGRSVHEGNEGEMSGMVVTVDDNLLTNLTVLKTLLLKDS